jgi:glycosyltransferase involved in cell wall biosynthesis
MACGVPTVTSDTSSLPEVVADGAICIDPRDPVRLAELMGQILQERSMSRRLAELGLRRSRECSWRETARKTLEVYRTISSCRISPSRS